MLESKFQHELIGELENMFPGALVYKNESKQGLPDLTVLYGTHWALLECKKSQDAGHQPNQDYYVKRANEMSFSRFIYPENKQEVLNELQQAFRTGRQTCHSKSE
jgi:predicted NAD/FAD-dependent oxidoreductase